MKGTPMPHSTPPLRVSLAESFKVLMRSLPWFLVMVGGFMIYYFTVTKKVLEKETRDHHATTQEIQPHCNCGDCKGRR